MTNSTTPPFRLAHPPLPGTRAARARFAPWGRAVCIALSVGAGVCAGASRAAQDGIAAATGGPLARPAALVRAGRPTVQLDVAQAANRLVAVGERGVILLSDDQGAHWRQTPSPTSVTLTAVRFADDRNGWALGHFGTVLHTGDGGQSWQRQLDGNVAAALAQTAAQTSAKKAAPDGGDGDAERARRALVEAERLVADGPDKPFFDALFTDSQHGWIVGAYNLCFFTADGGATWQPALGRLNNPRGHHLYAIRSDPRDAGHTLYIAGEAGLLLRSDDAGQTFSRLPSPYAGSWFALAVAADGSVVAAGLRGTAFRSTDKGSTWTAIGGLPPVSVVSARISPDGRLWLGNQAGQVFVGRADAGPMQPWAGPPGATPLPMNALLPLDGRRVALATPFGVQVVQGQAAGDKVSARP